MAWPHAEDAVAYCMQIRSEGNAIAAAKIVTLDLIDPESAQLWKFNGITHLF